MYKNCVITGGTDGIGKELTIELVNYNYKVYVFSRFKYEDKLKEIYGNLYNKYIFFVKVDLSNINDIKQMVYIIKSNLIKVDLFIWNAGVSINQIKKPYITKNGYNKLYSVNFLSHAILTLELTKFYPNSRYIFISSISSNMPLNNYDLYELDSMKLFLKDSISYNDYGISKYYMNIFCKYLYQKYKLDILSIEPGFVLSTKMNENRNKLVMKFNKIFIVEPNSLQETTKFLMSKILVQSKFEGYLQKFNEKSIEDYSEFNTNDLINSLNIICKKESIKCNCIGEDTISISTKEISEIRRNHTIKYKIYSWVKQLFILYPIIAYIVLFIYAYKQIMSYYSIIYVLICNNITKILQILIGKKRPSNKNTDLLIKNRKSKANIYSMPSVHSENAFLLATLIYFNSKIHTKTKIVFIFLAILVVYSRIFIGVHDYSDVIIGSIIGIIYGIFYYKYNKTILNNFKKFKIWAYILIGLLLLPEFTTIFYNFINRLNKIDSKNLTFIINHENMVGEKMLIMGTKKFIKKSKVIGYFHSSKPKNLLCLDYAGKKEFKIAPKPDKIIFNSNSYKIFFESKYSKLICKNGPALKQLYLNKLPNKKNISEDILVLFSGNYRDIYIMFKLLNNIKSKYSMIFRMHPMLLFDVKKYYTFNNYIVNNKSNLVDLITMSRKVISTYSATAIEASLIGKSVGLIYDKTRIRLNPYDDLGLNNYNLISDSLELQHFINDKTNLTKTRSVFNLDKNLINEFKNLN